MAQELFADEDCGVLEIGPGIGVLTKELCRCAGKVVAIELDRRLFPVLSETLGDFDNFKLVEGDAMELDLAELIKDDFSGFKSVKVCANLPYYITSPIIMRLLESELDIDEIVVMVQKEAAERLCATPGTRKSGAVTYAVNFYGSAEVLFEVGRESFMPSPNVDSAVIKITLDSSNSYDIEDKDAFFALIKAAFSQRRKTLVNSVSATLNIPKAEIISALESAELDKNVRAEKLTMEEFAKLTKLLQIN